MFNLLSKSLYNCMMAIQKPRKNEKEVYCYNFTFFVTHVKHCEIIEFKL